MAKTLEAASVAKPRGYQGRPASEEVIQAALRAGKMGPGGISVMKPRIRVMGELGRTVNEDWLSKVFGKGKGALKTPGGKTAAGIGVAMLIEALVSGALNIAGKVGESNLQGQAMNAQAEALRGPAGKEKAMQPITKAQRDQAMMLLMRQLGVQQSNLADGEALT